MRIEKTDGTPDVPPPDDSDKNKKKRVTPAELRQELISLFDTPDQSFGITSKRIHVLLQSHCPEEVEQLNEFIKKEQVLIDQLKSHGWKKHKQQLGTDMGVPRDGLPSIEDVRLQLVEHVTTLCLALMNKIGFDPPGEHLATGSPGWNSDIDTVYQPPKDMPHLIQGIEKLTFDAIFYAFFEVSSGYLCDTESYLPHAGEAKNTESKITSEQGLQYYAAIELNAFAMQLMTQCDSPTSRSWELTKSLYVMSGNDTLRVPISQALTQVEILEKMIQEGISNLRNELPSDYLAAMTLKQTAVIAISSTLDMVEQETAELEKKVTHDANCQTSLENRYLFIGNLLLLRARFFDEGYFSQGAFNEVCERLGGQKHRHSVKEHQKVTRRVQSVQSGKLSRDSLRNLSRHSLNLPSAQQQESSPLQKIISALENLAMYQGHYRHAIASNPDDLLTIQRALVAQSKYSERVLSNLAQLSRLLIRARVNIRDLRKDIQGIHRVTQALELVKRAKCLNYVTAETLLTEYLYEHYPLVLLSAKEIVKLALAKNEQQVQEYILEETILPEDMYNQLIGYFADITEIESDSAGNLRLIDSGLNDILLARCGLQSSDNNIIALHQRSVQITLDKYGFNCLDSIFSFNSSIIRVMVQVLNLCAEKRVAPLPKDALSAEFLMGPLWQEVVERRRNK